MPKIEDVEQAKAVALYEFRKIHPYGVTVKMNAQRMSAVWIVRIILARRSGRWSTA